MNASAARLEKGRGTDYTVQMGSEWRMLRSLLARTGLGLRDLAVPIALILAAAAVEGLSYGLLLPALRGLFERAAASPGADSGRFLPLLALVVAGQLARSALRYLAAYGLADRVRRFSARLRGLVYERYLGFGKSFFDGESPGRLCQTLVGYPQQVAHGLNVLNGAVYAVCALAAYLGLMAWISWPLTAAAAAVSLLALRAIGGVSRDLRGLSQDHARAYSALAGKAADVLACIGLVRAHASEASEREAFARANGEVAGLELGMDRRNALVGPLYESLLLAAAALMAAGTGLQLMRADAGRAAGLVVFFMLLRRSTAMFLSLSRSQAALAAMRGPIAELEAVFDDRGKAILPEGRIPFAGLRRSVEFDRVGFSYPGGARALEEVSFSLEKGRVTALVGASGAGKTTVVNLLLRFHDPSSGAVRIDGVDLREMTSRSLRGRIALVGQEAPLFNASLRENLRYGRQDASDRELEEALARVGLERLAGRLSEALGDRGGRLSAGERQRLAVARAALKGAELWVLDEPTSALDARSEAVVEDLILEETRGKTVLMVSHRAAVVRRADKVVLLEDGRVAREGPASEVLAGAAPSRPLGLG